MLVLVIMDFWFFASYSACSIGVVVPLCSYESTSFSLLQTLLV